VAWPVAQDPDPVLPLYVEEEVMHQGLAPVVALVQCTQASEAKIIPTVRIQKMT
jgi:hypothetical protein